MKLKMKYESFHHEYEPRIRFSAVKQQAAYGDVTGTRQLAMLYALGIGCDADPEKAALNLKRCLYWCDGASAKLLSYLAGQAGNQSASEMYGSVYAALGKLGDSGLLGISALEMAGEEREIVLCASMIKSMIIIPYKLNEIDIPFIDVISRKEIPAEKKLMYICRYRDMTWKNEIFDCKSNRRIGY